MPPHPCTEHAQPCQEISLCVAAQGYHNVSTCMGNSGCLLVRGLWCGQYEVPVLLSAQVYENYKRMFVPEGKPEVGDEKEALRATVFYHIVQVGHPNLAPLAKSSRCHAHGRALNTAFRWWGSASACIWWSPVSPSLMCPGT